MAKSRRRRRAGQDTFARRLSENLDSAKPDSQNQETRAADEPAGDPAPPPVRQRKKRTGEADSYAERLQKAAQASETTRDQEDSTPAEESSGDSSNPKRLRKDRSKMIDSYAVRLADTTEAAAPVAAPLDEQVEEMPLETGPVGQGDYKVRDGDSIPSIAHEHGHFWETIWDDAANKELRTIRKDPNVLLPKDRVTIPEKQRRDEPIEAEQRHVFERRGEPAELRLQLMIEDQPIAGEPYEITVDGKAYPPGTTDAYGNVVVPMPSNAKQATLLVGNEDEQRVYELSIGHTDPTTGIRGAQQRLHNLGFLPGEIDGDLGPGTEAALCEFQTATGLPESGQLDRETMDRLRKEHGS